MSEVGGRRARAVGFEELDVFQRAYAVSLEVHRTSLGFPAIEQRALADQVRRASKSICANVAEGFAKQTHSVPEFKRFLLMAMGSSDEMRLWSRYCRDLGYIDDATERRWHDAYQEIARMLNGLHRKAGTHSGL
jgi:four helix bundle protein